MCNHTMHQGVNASMEKKTKAAVASAVMVSQTLQSDLALCVFATLLHSTKCHIIQHIQNMI